MTYRRVKRRFGVPWAERVPSLVYLVTALLSGVFVLIGEHAGTNTWLFYFVVVQDPGRVVGARAFAAFLLLSALAAVLQGALRGVLVRSDGLEMREVTSWFWPRARRLRWAQLAVIVLDQAHVYLELWDGRRVVVPTVADRPGLHRALERVASLRGIPVQGGVGLDDLPEREDVSAPSHEAPVRREV
jgi:hypothetical protein